jgi:hypothetical protein
MRILILDDEKVRHVELAEAYIGNDIVHAETYNKFLCELESGSPWDLIHLDHDLGPGDSYMDGWGNMQFFTGQHAAVRVCELQDHLLPKKVVVHSMNPIGSSFMVTDLKSRKIDVLWSPYNVILKRKQGDNENAI